MNNKPIMIAALCVFFIMISASIAFCCGEEGGDPCPAPAGNDGEGADGGTQPAAQTNQDQSTEEGLLNRLEKGEVDTTADNVVKHFKVFRDKFGKKYDIDFANIDKDYAAAKGLIKVQGTTIITKKGSFDVGQYKNKGVVIAVGKDGSVMMVRGVVLTDKNNKVIGMDNVKLGKNIRIESQFGPQSIDGGTVTSDGKIIVKAGDRAFVTGHGVIADKGKDIIIRLEPPTGNIEKPSVFFYTTRGGEAHVDIYGQAVVKTPDKRVIRTTSDDSEFGITYKSHLTGEYKSSYKIKGDAEINGGIIKFKDGKMLVDNQIFNGGKGTSEKLWQYHNFDFEYQGKDEAGNDKIYTGRITGTSTEKLSYEYSGHLTLFTKDLSEDDMKLIQNYPYRPYRCGNTDCTGAKRSIWPGMTSIQQRFMYDHVRNDLGPQVRAMIIEQMKTLKTSRIWDDDVNLIEEAYWRAVFLESKGDPRAYGYSNSPDRGMSQLNKAAVSGKAYAALDGPIDPFDLNQNMKRGIQMMMIKMDIALKSCSGCSDDLIIRKTLAFYNGRRNAYNPYSNTAMSLPPIKYSPQSTSDPNTLPIGTIIPGYTPSTGTITRTSPITINKDIPEEVEIEYTNEEGEKVTETVKCKQYADIYTGGCKDCGEEDFFCRACLCKKD